MIWGTLVGVLGGVGQDIFHYVKDQKEKNNDIKRQIELEAKKSELRIKEQEAGVLIAKEETKQADFSLQNEKQKTFGIKAQTEGMVGVAEQETEREWYNNITKATGYIQGESKWVQLGNFANQIARPFLTFMLLMFQFAFIGGIVWKLTPQNIMIMLSNEGSALYQIVISLHLLLETVFGFWFYRRSSDKMRELSIQKKK